MDRETEVVRSTAHGAFDSPPATYVCKGCGTTIGPWFGDKFNEETKSRNWYCDKCFKIAYPNGIVLGHGVVVH